MLSLLQHCIWGTIVQEHLAPQPEGLVVTWWLHSVSSGPSSHAHSTAQHSTAQHSTAQHSTAQHSTPALCRAQQAGQAHICQWQELAIQRRSILQLRMLGHMPLQHLRSSSSRRSADGYIWIIQIGHDMVPHKLQQVILSKVKCAQGEQGNSNQGRPLQFPCTQYKRIHFSNCTASGMEIGQGECVIVCAVAAMSWA